MVRVAGLEPTASCSQSRRATNCATPGYSISAMIPRRRGKSKNFLSVVIPVVKAAFVLLSATGESPANAGVARLCGVSPCSVPDTATALPKQARYQLRYTRILSFSSSWSCFPKAAALHSEAHSTKAAALHPEAHSAKAATLHPEVHSTKAAALHPEAHSAKAAALHSEAYSPKATALHPDRCFSIIP